jgi:hypothetical protein
MVSIPKSRALLLIFVFLLLVRLLLGLAVVLAQVYSG